MIVKDGEEIRRTPLNPIHFNPTSLINSAIATPSLVLFSSLTALYSFTIDSGEFIVIIAAVDRASHDGRPSFCAVASLSIFLYIDSMPRGAGIGPGRACAAFIRAFRFGASFDMLGGFVRRVGRCNGDLDVL